MPGFVRRSLFYAVLGILSAIVLFLTSSSILNSSPNIPLLLPPPQVRSGKNLIVGVYDYPYLDRESKLLFCFIPRNMCTQFKSLFCRKQANRTIAVRDGADQSEVDFLHGTCHYQIEKINNEDVHIFKDPEWNKWAVLRDPLDRFLAAWTDKCFMNVSERPPSELAVKKGLFHAKHCYGCKQDLTCFLEENYSYLANLSETGYGFYTSNESFSSVDQFFPQFWFCGFHSFLPYYSQLFRYEKSHNFGNLVRESLLNISWPIDHIISGWGAEQRFLGELSINLERNSKINLYRDELLGSKYLKTLFLKTYLVDYTIFGFGFEQFGIVDSSST